MGCERSEGRGYVFGRDVRRGAWLLGVLLSGGAVLSMARAAEVPDDGLLEFLGSVDSEDKDWHDYLARTDIDQVARRTSDGANSPPAVSVPVHHNPADPPASAPAGKNPPPSSAGAPSVQP
jgi:hypothetical protein